jgi:hypothetical protein
MLGGLFCAGDPLAITATISRMNPYRGIAGRFTRISLYQLF